MKINKPDLPLFIFLESSDEVDDIGSGSSISMSSVYQKHEVEKTFNRKVQAKKKKEEEKIQQKEPIKRRQQKGKECRDRCVDQNLY